MKTTQINNKHYQECDVVMLETDKAEDSLVIYKKRLWFFSGYFTQEYLKSLLAKSYHLYILSNDEIKEGDWYCSPARIISKHNGTEKLPDNWKKIIATTENSLSIKKERSGENVWTQQLPQIPKSFTEHFINEYNKGNLLQKCLVEVVF